MCMSGGILPCFQSQPIQQRQELVDRSRSEFREPALDIPLYQEKIKNEFSFPVYEYVPVKSSIDEFAELMQRNATKWPVYEKQEQPKELPDTSYLWCKDFVAESPPVLQNEREQKFLGDFHKSKSGKHDRYSMGNMPIWTPTDKKGYQIGAIEFIVDPENEKVDLVLSTPNLQYYKKLSRE